MNGVCRSIRIIMTLQLTLIRSEVDLIIKFLNPAFSFLSYNPKGLEKAKTTTGHNYLFGKGLRVDIHSF